MGSCRHSGCLASAGAAAMLALAPEPGAAQTNAELMEIIRQQQRQIEELSRRVDALQGQAQQATERADAAAEAAQKVEADSPMSRSSGRRGRPSRAGTAAGRCTCSAA